MKITHCKILRKHQLRLLEYFVLEVTARSAADLIGIQPNSAALFYRKLREVIAYHLEQKEHKYSMAQLSWMRVISVESARANVVEGQRVRLQSLVY